MNGVSWVYDVKMDQQLLHAQASPWCEFNGGEGWGRKKSKSSLGEIERLKNGCTHVCAQAAQPYTPIRVNKWCHTAQIPDIFYPF